MNKIFSTLILMGIATSASMNLQAYQSIQTGSVSDKDQAMFDKKDLEKFNSQLSTFGQRTFLTFTPKAKKEAVDFAAANGWSAEDTVNKFALDQKNIRPGM